MEQCLCSRVLNLFEDPCTIPACTVFIWEGAGNHIDLCGEYKATVFRSTECKLRTRQATVGNNIEVQYFHLVNIQMLDTPVHVQYAHTKGRVNVKLFGMFYVHINRSGSYWDIHVFDLLVSPCLEMTFYQRLQGSFTCHWGSNDTGPPL